MCRKIVERGIETGEPFRARRGGTGSCWATGRTSARTDIGGRLRRVQLATKDEYRYKLKKIHVHKIDTDIDTTWISLSAN